MKKIILLACLFITTNLFSQLPDGSIAPDFTGYDINGEEHNLYDILASGKNVIIDFFFTTCGPCWNWHNTGILEDLYHEVGPEGTDEVVILMIEGRGDPDIDAIYGIGENTAGDWTEDTSYPIMEFSNLANIYRIYSYPTIIKICQDRRIEKINEIRTEGVPFALNELDECPSVEYASEPFFIADKYLGCGSLEVQFEDQSWPRPNTWLWDFGDGNTSTEQSPLHLYESEGTYNVNLTVMNEFGKNQITKSDLITVGEGESYSNQIVGELSPSSGYYNELSNRHLVFDAYDDLIISSVKVYGDKDQERTFVLLDESWEIIQSKTVSIPEGEHRVELNFVVSEGQNFKLGLKSQGYFKIDSTSNYPYIIEDLISIKGHSANSGNDYYYFYEWEVRPAACMLVSSNSTFISESLNLYPNPSNGILNLEHIESMQTEFSIYNIAGQKCELTSQDFGNYTQFDISKIPQGVYFIEMIIDNKTARAKFIKAR